MDPRHFAEVAFALGILGREQMPARRLGTQNFAATGDLEPLRDCFACLAARDWFRHEARKIDAGTVLTTAFRLRV